MIRFNGEPYESKGSCTVRWGGDALSFIKKEARSLPNPFGVDRMAAKVARSGARMGKPRGARILAITGGCLMAAMIVKGPPLLRDTVQYR